MRQADSIEQRAGQCHFMHPEPAECGAACLKAVVRFYGEDLSFDVIRAKAGGNGRGISLKELHQAAEYLGLKSGAYTGRLEHLMKLTSPAILHLSRENGGQSFVVCYGFTGSRFIIGDPETGIRKIIPKQLAKLWKTGVLLTLEPKADFTGVIKELNLNAIEQSEREEAQPTPDKYCCWDVKAHQVGSNQVLLFSRTTNISRMVTSDQAALLFAFDKFETLEHGTARIFRHLSQGKPGPEAIRQSADGELEGENTATRERFGIQHQQVRAQLDSFVREGFLVPETCILEQIETAGERFTDKLMATPEITTLGIPTGNRPDSLQRSAAGYIKNARDFGRALRLVVADDSRQPAISAKNQEVLRRLGKQDRIQILYMNRPHRQEYAKTLAHYMEIDPAITRFALWGDTQCALTSGAARNALLLQTIGELSVQVDDDTICRVAPSSTGNTGVRLSSGGDVNEYRFYPDYDTVLAQTTFESLDFLAIHEQLLGRVPAGFVTEAVAKDTKVSVETLRPERLASLVAPESRVDVTFLGLVGDSATGMHGHLPRLFLQESSFRHMVKTESGYRRNLLTRYVSRAPTGTIVTDSPACMSMNIGMDHHVLLPPFMPVNRNQDGVFGSLHSICHLRSFKGYLPYMLLHNPPVSREHPAELEAGIASPRVNDLIRWLVLGYETWPRTGNPAGNLRSLGRYLWDFSNQKGEDFFHDCRDLALQSLGAYLMQGERRLLESGDAPQYWKEDLEKYLTIYREKITGKDFFIPRDLPGVPEERLDMFQTLVRRFGEVLVVWPDMIAAAKELQAKEIFPAVSLKEVDS